MVSLTKCEQILNKDRKEKLAPNEIEEVKLFLENYSKIIIHNMLNEN